MKTYYLTIFPLWTLVIFGFVSAVNVSIDNFSGVACPSLLSVPICYVVTTAYALMLGVLVANHRGYRHYLFYIGWGVAFVIALLASIAEFVGGGGICPSSTGGLREGFAAAIPLCYLSLGALMVIFVLFIKWFYRPSWRHI